MISFSFPFSCLLAHFSTIRLVKTDYMHLQGRREKVRVTLCIFDASLRETTNTANPPLTETLQRRIPVDSALRPCLSDPSSPSSYLHGTSARIIAVYTELRACPWPLCADSESKKKGKSISMTVKENSAGVEGLRLETRQPSVCWCSLIFEGLGRRGGSCQWVGVGSVAPRPNSCEESWQLQSLWDARRKRQSRDDTRQKVWVGFIFWRHYSPSRGQEALAGSHGTDIMLGCHLNRSLASNIWARWKDAAGKKWLIFGRLSVFNNYICCEEGGGMEN